MQDADKGSMVLFFLHYEDNEVSYCLLTWQSGSVSRELHAQSWRRLAYCQAIMGRLSVWRLLTALQHKVTSLGMLTGVGLASSLRARGGRACAPSGAGASASCCSAGRFRCRRCGGGAAASCALSAAQFEPAGTAL